MRTINTIEELRLERRALRSKASYLEAEIRNDLQEIKAMLAPMNVLTTSAEKVLVSQNNGLLGNTAGTIADFITRNVIMRNAGFLSRLVVPYLVKNVTSNVVDNNKTDIVSWIGSMISKITSRKKEKKENADKKDEE